MTKKHVDHTLKHLQHKIAVDTIPINTKDNKLTHPGKMICVECNKQIRWLSKHDIKLYNEYRLLCKTYGQFLKLKINSYERPDQNNVIYLALTYKEKDIAKSNQAKWDPFEKLWYTTLNNPKAINLTEYMLPQDILWLNNYRAINFIE